MTQAPPGPRVAFLWTPESTFDSRIHGRWRTTGGADAGGAACGKRDSEGARRRVGAPTRLEQLQQWQAALQRWADEAPRRTRSLREPSGKKPGGQKGHKGETLRQVAEPDAVIEHFPSTCATCSEALPPAMSTGFNARQVFDLPEPPPPVVTEHRAHNCTCATCGAKTSAAFPEGVNAPVQYGPRIVALVIYLLHYHLLPEARLAALLDTLFGIKIVPATIARMSRSCAVRLQDFAATLSDLVAGAEVKHMDETGLRIGGKTQWLHVACTTLLTFYRVCTKRGSLMANVTGIVVHDHWKPYYTLSGVLHALCNAHHLRELKARIEIEKEDWARKMQLLLRRACHAVNVARERGAPLKPNLFEVINRRYDAIAAEGMAFHEAQSPLEPATTPAGCPKKRGRRRASNGTQSSSASCHPQGGCSALHHRPAGSLHQQ